jgi:RimJ/RimL family protein N-acetyltransferase
VGEAGVTIRRLGTTDAVAYRAFRLRAVRETPLAFTASFDEESAKPLAATVARLAPPGRPDDAVFGAFDGPEELIGIVGLSVAPRPQERHLANLFGMGVAREATRRGVGRALVLRVLEYAQSLDGVLQVELRVSEGNEAAERLYCACGFEEWGRQRRAVMVQGTAVTKIHMVCMLDA